MAFAAVAMLFVVAEDIIPDAKAAKNPHIGQCGVMAGFAVTMVLGVVFG